MSQGRTRDNPAVVVLGNPPEGAELLSPEVLAVEYQHIQDPEGRPYRHEFHEGVRMHVLEDGRVLLSHPRKRLWKDFPNL